jgi:hypothetical protein
MKSHLVTTAVILAASLLANGTAPKTTTSALEKRMIKTVYKGLDALVAGDVKTFLDGFADDAIILDENGPVGKKQLVEFFKIAHFKRYKIDDVKFLPLTSGSGILSYRNKEDGFMGKQPFTFNVYISLVFKTQGNRLLIEFVQETNVKEK